MCHHGPPLSSHIHASTFLDKYIKTDVYGPFLEGDHYVVEKFRDFNDVVSLLNSDLIFTARIGPDIESALRDHYRVLSKSELLSLTDDFGIYLQKYFNPNL